MNEIGAFQHQSVLEIHSRQAKSLVMGRYHDNSVEADAKAYPIYGLVAYGFLLMTIWQRTRADDPYAELTLIEVERRIQNAFHLLNKLNKFIEEKLSSSLPGIQLDLYTSKQPLKLSLSEKAFATTHAKLGARLVGFYDLLIRKLVTGKQFGVINTKTFGRYQYRAGRVIRGVFTAPAVYRNIHVKRSDIEQKTEKGVMAINQGGPIPLDILNRERHSEFGPLPQYQQSAKQ